MIGEAFRPMISIKPTTWLSRLAMFIVLCCYSLTYSVGQAASTATVTITATFIAATCDITVPSTYWLGTLTPGIAKKHSPLKIDLTCDGNLPVKTALKATVITGVQNSTNDKLEMMVAGAKNGTLLWLEDDSGKSIKFSGNDTDVFCIGEATGPRSCNVIPVTEAHSTDKFGIANAALQFEVVYQ